LILALQQIKVARVRAFYVFPAQHLGHLFRALADSRLSSGQVRVACRLCARFCSPDVRKAKRLQL
jgi:hypothetical protein